MVIQQRSPEYYDALLAAMEMRFRPDMTVRRPPLNTASPAPAEEVRRKYAVDHEPRIAAIAPQSPTANRKAPKRTSVSPKHFRPVVSPRAVLANCQHEWQYYHKTRAKCGNCGTMRMLSLLPGVVLARKTRKRTEVLPPCTDPRGHRENWDGKTKAGARRIRCIRCEATRGATEAECAARVTKP